MKTNLRQPLLLIKKIAFITLLVLICSKQSNASVLPVGIWRGIIQIQGQELPFNFEITKKGNTYFAYLLNSTERLLLDEVRVTPDSVEITLHIFDAVFKAAIRENQLHGVFTINYAKDYNLPFKAFYGQPYRFIPSDTVNHVRDFSGKYSVQFFNPSNTVSAMGIFKQSGNHVEGTFLTPTGDHRYLEGNVVRDTLWLSTFDGNHLYLFNATMSNDTLRGTQWMGNSRNRKWMGIKDEKAQPPSSEGLSYLKEGFEKLNFALPNVKGETVSLNDQRFKNKVIIVQIFGTWCPNCMDETRFLTSWYSQNKNRSVEILGIAFEQKPDFNYARDRVLKMKEKFNVPYEILIGGTADNPSAAFPELNKVVGTPTMIFVGRDGLVKEIRTGFSGPGTGIYFEQEKEHFNNLVNDLLGNK